MERPYTISQLGQAAGVPISTVRYYERNGLLRPDGRTEANYRIYGASALKRLRFIRAAQANGFTLDDISALLAFRDGTTLPCKAVQTLVEQRLLDLQKRLKELRHVQEILKSSLEMCRKSEPLGKCFVIDKLSATSSSATRGRPGSSGS
jgi:DNA-binding transcriptional MerR regulator